MREMQGGRKGKKDRSREIKRERQRERENEGRIQKRKSGKGKGWRQTKKQMEGKREKSPKVARLPPGPASSSCRKEPQGYGSHERVG